MASAHTPWCGWGWIDCRCALLAPIGSSPFFGRDIISVPPAMTRSSMPAMMALAAMLVAVMPDPQKRSSVTPLASHVVAGVERGHAAEVAALLAHLGARAPHDVVDVGGVEVVAIGQRLEDGAGQVLRVEVGQRPLAGLADAARRPAGVDDQGVRHGVSSGSWSGSASVRRGEQHGPSAGCTEREPRSQARARSRSASRSSIDSMPTDSRTRSVGHLEGGAGDRGVGHASPGARSATPPRRATRPG